MDRTFEDPEAEEQPRELSTSLSGATMYPGKTIHIGLKGHGQETPFSGDQLGKLG